jgi:hypothetical protein
MRPHVHDESESASGGDHLHRWGAERMRKHLRDVHDLSVPMSWDIGQLHQTHLADHQKATGRSFPTTAEEAPMTQTPHEHTAAEHRGDGPELAQHLGKAHGYHSSNDLENFVVTHRQLHAEAAGEDQQVEEAARALWVQETGRPEGSWNDTSRDVRAHFRRKIRQQQIGYGAASREHGERHAEYRIMVDRVTAVMAGLDFDRDWAADDGIGPNARGALRVTFQRAAEQTLTWLERGGLAAIPGYLDLLDERVRQERDHAQQTGAAAAQEAAQLRQQMGEQQRAMQEMAQDRELAESLNRDLEETNNQLREQLATTGRQLQTVLAEKDQLFEVAAQMERERNAVQQRLEMTQTASTNLQQQIRSLQEANDRQVQAIMALEEQLGAAADLREERDRLRWGLARLVTALRDTGWSGSTVFQRLESILGEPVSTVTEASQAPAEQPTLIRGDASGVRHITLEEARAEDEGEDDLSWARRFAEGGEA